MTDVYTGTPHAARVILADADTVAHHAAEWIATAIDASTGRFALSLAGGSTPRRLYELLAAAPYRDRLPWSRLHLFFGDERMVPYDHADSNARMVREALLDHVPIPPGNVLRMPTDLPAAEAAAQYQVLLSAYYGDTVLDPARPLFDITLLGLGDNGHTASLFPGTPALDETLAWVAPVSENVPQPRLTLTYPVLASSRHIAFLVTGAGKREALARVWNGDRTQPATRVRAVGDLRWIVDREAAG